MVAISEVSGETADRCGVIDLHCHPNMMAFMFGLQFSRAHRPWLRFVPWSMRVDMDALLAGGVKAFLCTTYVLERVMFDDVWPLRALAAVAPRAKRIATAPIDQLCLEYLDTAEGMVDSVRRTRGDVIEVARNYDEMQRIMGAGKICMLHAVEGAHHLNGNIDMVDALFARGVCQMILPHLYPNESGGCVDVYANLVKGFRWGCFKKQYQDASGLTRWGEDLVEKLLDVGILVDPTHGTRDYRRRVFDIVHANAKKRPLIMSHACVPSLSPEGMGPLPEEIREIADTGGVVGLMMYTHRESAGAPGSSGIDFVLRGIAHLVEHGGEDVVAIGSDFDGTPDVPPDLRSPRDFAQLRAALRAVYPERQVEKFMNGNADRVLRMGWGA